MLDAVVTREAENRRLLESAGYAWDEQTDTWEHPGSGRMLNGRIARTLAADQLAAWIRNGLGRPR